MKNIFNYLHLLAKYELLKQKYDVLSYEYDLLKGSVDSKFWSDLYVKDLCSESE